MDSEGKVSAEAPGQAVPQEEREMSNDNISTVEIEQDIEDTEREIAQMEREEQGLRLIGDKLSCYKADARRDGIKERRAFIAKLKLILDERAQDRHQTGCICADCSGAELTADND